MTLTNDFDRYRHAKEKHGGRIDKHSPWVGWSIIAGLSVLTIIAWVFAIPGYQNFAQGDPSVSADINRSQTPSRPSDAGGNKLLPGLLLTEREPDEMAVVFLDVGQGDAIFIQTPDKHTMLIDSGEGTNPDYEYARKIDAAHSLILPFFQKNKIEKLDVFVESHPHSDHIGSAADILNNIPVDELWLSGHDHPSKAMENMLYAAKQQNTTTRAPIEVGGNMKEGSQFSLGDYVNGWILRTAPKDKDINNASLALMLYYGETGMIFAGDTEGSREGGGLGEQELVKTWGEQLDVEILKINHHGSRFSSAPTFIDYIDPDHSVFMVGHYNTFGHPTDEVISRVRKAGSKIHRTDEDGTIYMFTDGDNIRVINQRDFTAVN